MQLSLEPKAIEDVYQTPLVQQTAFWSRVKATLGMKSRAFEFSVRNSDIYTGVGGWSRTNADVVVFAQQVNDEDWIAYMPYGPEIEPSEENQGVFLEELSEELRRFLPKGCIALRYDLNWQSHWVMEQDFDADGEWRGGPRKVFQEMQLNFGTVNGNLFKSLTNVLPADTIVVDLAKSEEDMLGAMKAKTRYNIGLSSRHGIEVRELGFSDLPVWYSLYTETYHRNGLHVNDLRYFESVFSVWMKHLDPNVTVKLLAAFDGDEPLAAMFLIVSAHRATYLYGASSSRKRNLMPTYALQFKAMQIARAAGCTEYDMFGVAPTSDPSHPMHGLYKFKTGFGGSMFHQLGFWDYPLDEKKYHAFAAHEMGMAGYYA